jgi:PhnB protein
MSISYLPDGYNTISPYLFIDGAAEAMAYYCKVFGASEKMKMSGPGGKIMHAELQIGECVIMLADEFAEMNVFGPKKVGGSPVLICIYVEDADATVELAVKEGATIERPMQDQFYGDRSGSIVDPFGHRWTIATHIEDVTPEEIEKRMASMGGE